MLGVDPSHITEKTLVAFMINDDNRGDNQGQLTVKVNGNFTVL